MSTRPTFIIISFALQLLFGLFLLTAGDIIDGPLFLLTAIFGLYAITHRRYILSSAMLYLATMAIFIVQFIQSTIHMDRELKERLSPNRPSVLVILISILLGTVIMASLTLIHLNRFYIHMEVDVQASDKTDAEMVIV